MFYKILFDRLVDFIFLYTVLDMPRQIRIVCLAHDAVLCFVNSREAIACPKRSTEPRLAKTIRSQGWNFCSRERLARKDFLIGPAVFS